jgi:ubiquitin-protein ligase
MDLNLQMNEFKNIIENFNNIKLLNYNQIINDMVIYLNILINENQQSANAESIANNIYFQFKLITDFNAYCYFDQSKQLIIDDTINSQNKLIIKNIINNFNLSIIFKIKSPIIIINNILEIINKYKIINTNHFIISDTFHIFQEIQEYTKFKINYIELEKSLNKYKTNTPNNLLFSSLQINKLIIKEIQTINNNRNYEHYITVNYSDPYIITVRLIFDKETNIGIILNNINNNLHYNYIEFNLILDAISYPFTPPKIYYIKPKIKNELLIGLLDLNILKNQHWKSNITLEYLIINIANQFETIGYKYIITNFTININDIAINDLNNYIMQLLNIIKYDNINKIKLEIAIPKIDTSNNPKYWKSGTGYSSNNATTWDINSYITSQKNKNEEIITILHNIYNLINNNKEIYTDEDIINILLLFLTNQINQINLLEIEKYEKLYVHIFLLLDIIIDKNLNNNFINETSNKLKQFFDEFDNLLNNSINTSSNMILIHGIAKKYYYKNLEISNISDNKSNQNIINNISDYINIMKNLQFNKFELSSQHRFYNKKNIKLEQKTLIRILSEISGFKTELPLNWESSVWIRISKDNCNILSFLISGPKDTPYENGLFEFHAYFPADYPNTVPEVLINTTGNNHFRFNPNLYKCGKVCLSLLNTWNGNDGEKWNKNTSTFLQVLISIQSLILVDQPYFNEPGYERDINTDKGKKKSDLYNEEIHPNTIKLAMIDIINNPPSGFEEIIANHFKFKKDEILCTILKWEENASKFKNDINKYRLEFESII